MELRDSMSSTATLGYRIDAVLTPTGHKTAFKSNLFRVQSQGDVVAELRAFLPRSAACAAAGYGAHPRALAARFADALARLETDLRASPVFATHEFIGSTLFFVADARGKCARALRPAVLSLRALRPRARAPPPAARVCASSRCRCGVWMIDFGITRPANRGEGGTLRHDVPWVAGNHEDGYLVGLAKLQAAWRALCDEEEWV